MISKKASDLAPGDIVRMNPQVSWRVDSIEQVTDKCIHYAGTYLRCDFTPALVGQSLGGWSEMGGGGLVFRWGALGRHGQNGGMARTVLRRLYLLCLPQ